MTLRELTTPQQDYSYGYLDTYAKRELRRRTLKAIAIPGYQVPYASRELPIARGWGTGGLQVTLALVGPESVVKVIDQGADDSVNAANLRRFITRMSGCGTTTDTLQATLLQSRHRIPEEVMQEGQALILQVPDPEPLRAVQPDISKAAGMHADADYGQMWLGLYEQLVRFKQYVQGASYPSLVNGRYVISPSPIPRWDTPKLHQPALGHAQTASVPQPDAALRRAGEAPVRRATVHRSPPAGVQRYSLPGRRSARVGVQDDRCRQQVHERTAAG